MANDQDCVVTVEPGRPVAEVAEALARAGLQIGETLSEIGVIIGRCPPEAMARLRAVAGVSDVSLGRSIDIGPPGSPRTW